jgi:hypothetical protein
MYTSFAGKYPMKPIALKPVGWQEMLPKSALKTMQFVFLKESFTSTFGV